MRPASSPEIREGLSPIPSLRMLLPALLVMVGCVAIKPGPAAFTLKDGESITIGADEDIGRITFRVKERVVEIETEGAPNPEEDDVFLFSPPDKYGDRQVTDVTASILLHVIALLQLPQYKFIDTFRALILNHLFRNKEARNWLLPPKTEPTFLLGTNNRPATFRFSQGALLIKKGVLRVLYGKDGEVTGSEETTERLKISPEGGDHLPFVDIEVVE